MKPPRKGATTSDNNLESLKAEGVDLLVFIAEQVSVSDDGGVSYLARWDDARQKGSLDEIPSLTRFLDDVRALIVRCGGSTDHRFLVSLGIEPIAKSPRVGNVYPFRDGGGLAVKRRPRGRQM
jgi:hypothetical protein